jgi:allantoate deiminase
MDAREVIRRCRELAKITDEPGHITRTFLSPAMRAAYARVGEWMRAAGLTVEMDAAGNLRGARGEGRRLMIGSHLDTVPHAGAFDGPLGVIIGIALAERFGGPLEIVAFSEEEGVRFGVPFIGSRALVGDPVTRPDVVAAIRDFGLDPAVPVSLNARAYLEFHIEQGPVLESLDRPVAVVESIAGQSRYEVRFTGRSNHAGTTPMYLRQDALAGAAQWIGLVEREAVAAGVVATVGAIAAEPGAANVIAGAARATLDVRHARDDLRLRAVERILSGAREIAIQRGLSVEWEQRLDQSAVAMQCDELERAVQAAGYPVHRMTSGAGHDAMILARKVPVAMLFVRSPGGISHHPDETVREEDVAAALAVGEKYLVSSLAPPAVKRPK